MHKDEQLHNCTSLGEERFGVIHPKASENKNSVGMKNRVATLVLQGRMKRWVE